MGLLQALCGRSAGYTIFGERACLRIAHRRAHSSAGHGKRASPARAVSGRSGAGRTRRHAPSGLDTGFAAHAGRQARPGALLRHAARHGQPALRCVAAGWRRHAGVVVALPLSGIRNRLPAAGRAGGGPPGHGRSRIRKGLYTPWPTAPNAANTRASSTSSTSQADQPCA